MIGMFRALSPDGSVVQSKFLRGMLAVAYLMFTASGTVFILSGELTVIYGPAANVMAWFMAIGAALCAFGTVTRRWVGEFTGLPLLGTALIVLALQVWRASHEAAPFVAVGNAFLLLGLAALVGARWRQALATYRIAKVVGRHPR